MKNKRILKDTYEFFTREGDYRKQYHQNLCFALGYKLKERIESDLRNYGFDTNYTDQIIAHMKSVGFIVGITGFQYLPSPRHSSPNQFPEYIKDIASYVLNMDKFDEFFNADVMVRNLKQELPEQQLYSLYALVKWCADHPRHMVVDKSSYGLKHLLEGDKFTIRKPRSHDSIKVTVHELMDTTFDWFYIHNDQFKQAMLDCKVKIKRNSINQVNWCFAGGYNNGNN